MTKFSRGSSFIVKLTVLLNKDSVTVLIIAEIQWVTLRIKGNTY